mgnify:CR=1 FL=1
MFHKVKAVQPLQDMQLLVRFEEGTTKRYDVKPLLSKWKQFNALSVAGLFGCACVDVGGYGIVWNDELDLSCNELWENGQTVSTQ